MKFGHLKISMSIFGMLVVGCNMQTANHNNGECKIDTVYISAENSNPNQTMSFQENEEFYSFIYRFHTDSVFQAGRIVDELKGFDSDYAYELGEAYFLEEKSAVVTWDNDTLKLMLKSLDYDWKDDQMYKKYEPKDSLTVIESIGIPASSCVDELTYRKTNKGWMLVELSHIWM